MAEYVRNCAGGVVFAGDDVFLLKNDKGEWIMPKGIIRDRRNAREVALYRVEDEAGIQAEIVGFVGRTSYDFYSQTRRRKFPTAYSGSPCAPGTAATASPLSRAFSTATTLLSTWPCAC